MKKILVHFDFPTVTEAQYNQVWDDLKAAGYAHPKGLLYHVGAPRNGGGWMVFDVWDSEEAFKSFGETLMPMIKKAGIEGQPSIMPVANIVEPETV